MQSKTIPLALTALAMCATQAPATAADLRGNTWGRTAVAPEPYEQRYPIDDYRWSGFYLGGTVGYATGDTAVSRGATGFEVDQSGGAGTVFAGYNLQAGNFVIGLEGDIGTGSFEGVEGIGAARVASDLNMMGAIRGRAGVLVGPSFLVYGTAGIAWGDFDISANNETLSETFAGYQVGAGAELKFSDPWALRLEYVYTGFDEETLRIGSAAPRVIEPDLHTVRAGISYKF